MAHGIETHLFQYPFRCHAVFFGKTNASLSFFNGVSRGKFYLIEGASLFIL